MRVYNTGPVRPAVQGVVSAALIAVITLLLYQFPARLFFGLHGHGVQPYGLAYIAAFAVLTVWGGRRLGYWALLLAALGAALLLPPRSNLGIGDARGWLELAVLLLFGVMTVPAVDRGRTNFKPGQGRIRRVRAVFRRLFGLPYRLYALPSLMRHRPDVLLICSHMRSGSSLLSHLLFSHVDVCGYGEAHLYYTGAPDFDTLVGKVLMVLRRMPNGLRERFVLDKVIHSSYMDAPKVLPALRGRVRVILLVREPHGSLSSLINTFGYSENFSLNHYIDRMTFIARAAEEMASWTEAEGGRAVAVTYDQLLQRTEPAFRLVEDYLGLTQPLRENYEVLPSTGRIKIGDVSANIRSGAIIRDGRNSKPVLPLSEGTLARASAAYRQCLDTLERCCRFLPNDTESV